MQQIIWSEHFSVEELVDFSENNPWHPQFPNTLIRRFVNELISSRQKIFDLHDRYGRLAAAVLLDRVQNPGNDACLEVLGMRSDADSAEVFSRVIEWARQQTPAERSGFQLGVPADSSLDEEFFRRHQLVPYFQTFEMYCTDFSHIRQDNNREIRLATSNDADSIYNILREAFVNNPDTSIPEMNSWKTGFLRSSLSRFYVWDEFGEILGFVNIILSDETASDVEVRTLGVLPKSQGRGIGKRLLNFCLYQAKLLNTTACHLTVAVANQRALDIYLKAGFFSKDRYICYHSRR